MVLHWLCRYPVTAVGKVGKVMAGAGRMELMLEAFAVLFSAFTLRRVVLTGLGGMDGGVHNSLLTQPILASGWLPHLPKGSMTAQTNIRFCIK